MWGSRVYHVTQNPVRAPKIRGAFSHLSDPMPPDPYDHLWTCGYCDERFVVPTLARLHEAKHEREAMRDADQPDSLDRRGTA